MLGMNCLLSLQQICINNVHSVGAIARQALALCLFVIDSIAAALFKYVYWYG
jgi:hypothetical protein